MARVIEVDRLDRKEPKMMKHAKRIFGVGFWVFGFGNWIWGWEPYQNPSPITQHPKPFSRTYTIDISQSRMIVHLSQTGLIARRHPRHEVEVKDFKGKIEVSTRDEREIDVEVEAQTRSLTNIDKTMSEFERGGFHNVLRNSVLEAEKFPTIKFTSISVTGVSSAGTKFTLNGDLILHGVTRRVGVQVDLDKITDQELRATGEGTIKQSDFDIEPYEGGLGTIKIGDEVKVDFIIVAKSP
jgi:polyisoprenoid-binding protein YceI